MKNILEQQLKLVERQESKFLNTPVNPFMKSTLTPAVEKIQSMIPAKLKTALDKAFFKGFQFVFEKGSQIIEKTYDKEKLELDYDINNYAVDKRANKRHIKRIDKQSVQSKLINTSISAVEGGALGLLGIGLPDIPLFLSVILKTIYEIALSYGYGYSTEQEKTYILLLICGAITKDEEQKKFDEEIQKLGATIDQNIVPELKLEEQMKITSEQFTEALLTAKFIQGFPIIGVIGGIVNYNILNKISSYARIRFKKRYLIRKLAE